MLLKNSLFYFDSGIPGSTVMVKCDNHAVTWHEHDAYDVSF